MSRTDQHFARRAFLRLALGAPLVALAAGSAADAAGAVCIDPDALTDAELALRESLKFQEKSADPARVCGKCAFYTPHADATCGTCTLLHGPVTDHSVCSSFAVKKAAAASSILSA
jgi:hypothetical protein